MKDFSFSKVLSWSGIEGAAKDFVEKGGSGEIDITKAQNDLLPIGRILMGVGILTLAIVGMIMGVKYMFSGADERANMKQKLIWYIVSAVLIFGAISIYNIVAGVFNSAGI